MAKRRKSDPIEPINVDGIIYPGEFSDILPENIYKALQPTLANDWLFIVGTTGDFYLPARPLLDLSRLWKKEPSFVRFILDEANDTLIIKSGAYPLENAGTERADKFGFTSITRLKLTPRNEEQGERPEWADYKMAFIPLTFGIQNAPTKKITPRPSSWILRAVGNPNSEPREELTHHYGKFGTNGYRIHIDPTLPLIKTNPVEKVLAETVETLLSLTAKYETLITIDPKKFIQACKAAKAIRKNSVKISVNGSLELKSLGDEWKDNNAGTNRLSTESGYTHTGPDTSFSINPAYLIDALSGMTSEIILSAKNEKHPIYITDGTREALIMPMNL